MTNPRSTSDDRPNIGSEPLDDELRALAGAQSPEDQDAVVAPAEITDRAEPNFTALDRLETDRAWLEDEVATEDGGDRDASLDALALGELRADETGDPEVAAQEGLPWVPPTDPPVLADPEADGGIVVGAGFGSTAIDDPYDDSHLSGDLTAEGDLNARVREAIRADAATSGYADRILIAILGETLILRGTVDDLADTDELVAVAKRVEGVAEVRDETEVAALD